MKNKILNYVSKTTDSVSLAVFRVFFGLLMLISMIRFWAKGWIDSFYVKPDFFFSFYGFEWIKPIGEYTYLLFAICCIASFFVMIGYKYRLAIIVLFCSFGYIELMDKTYYLNHYYFLTVMSFLLCFLPANAYFSVDAYLDSSKRKQFIPKYSVDIVKLMLGIVYFYAGLAKLNSDWLFRASPLSIWLPVKHHYYLIGDLMHQTWFLFAMSWAGALYDLAIPFLLLYKRTRVFAFICVVIFHVFTRMLFPIGMFPYIMIVSTIIFFDAKLHHKILSFISKIFKIDKLQFSNGEVLRNIRCQKIILPFLILFLTVQLLMPFRHVLYPSELFWSEEGYRFSWRVMLVEKAGYAKFHILDKDTGKKYYIDNKDYLLPYQEKQMSFQSDFILEYAHYLGDIFKRKGVSNPAVYVENYVTLNGRLSTRFVKDNVDLYPLKEGLRHKEWFEKFSHPIAIKGL